MKDESAMVQDRLKLLLIEHDPSFARYVEEMLAQARDLSAEVTSVSSLTEGLAVLARGPFDAVLMELAVPDGAGLGNVAVVRAEGKQTPVIVAGESDDEVVALEAVHAGAQDYLVKGQLTPAWLERSVQYTIERFRLDRALLEAEEKYHNVFDHLVEGIFQTTPDGHYLMANAALARIYGYNSPEDLMESLVDIGRSLYVDPSRREEFVELMQEHDLITGFESQVYRKDETVIWISENCRAIRDKHGKLLYYEGTVEDITQRQEAERKLRHSEALYHSLVENLPQNIIRKNLEGQFTFANRQFCRALGVKLEDVIGKTDLDFFPKELAAKYLRDDHRVMDTGQPYETVEEHLPPGGKPMYVHVVKTPLRDANASIIGLQAIFWDITQQRLAEEKIRRANTALAQSRRELRIRNQQMEEDLHMAREIQLTMLPQQYPSFPHHANPERSVFRFTHRYLPTGSVGGDFFTVSALSDMKAAVFLCDVAGHGVQAALVTAMIRALVEELKPLATQPGQFMTKLNSDLHTILQHTGTPLLTTGFYLVADAETGVMQYANAGHPKPLHIRRSANSVVQLSNASGKSQPVLGLMPDAVYEASEILLLDRDLLLLFTDGLIEVENTEGTLYDTPLLVSAAQQHLKLNAKRMLDALLGEVRRFAANAVFSDDVCLVGMEYRHRSR